MRAYIRTRSLTDFSNLINLAEFGPSVRIYLSSVLLRHSYCNWASPVIVPPLLAEGLNNLILVKTYNLLYVIFSRRVAV